MLTDLNWLCRSTLLKETQEVHKLASTRVLHGAGCAVKRLLIGKEFVRLNIEGLPKNFTDQKLVQKIVELYPAAEVTMCCFET